MAVIRVRDANRVAYHASPLVRSIVTFVADSDERCRADVGIAHDAFPVALFAQTSEGDAGHLPAHDEVRVVFRHDDAMTKTSAPVVFGGEKKRDDEEEEEARCEYF